jgi:ribulose-bisphosphate carboxylase large chain
MTNPILAKFRAMHAEIESLRAALEARSRADDRGWMSQTAGGLPMERPCMAASTPRPEFVARYEVESSIPPARVAEAIAGEQSSGTFVAVPGETEELARRSRARVLRVEELGEAAAPTLHSARTRPGDRFARAAIDIAFPVANVGHSLPNILATVAGNLFELGEVTGLRLVDIAMTPEHAAGFPGPAFGIPGTRRVAGVEGRPLVGTIIKPSIGLAAEETARVVDGLCAGGIDFIKDDELVADPPYEPFSNRLRAVMAVLHRHADRLGRMPVYAINVTGSGDEMRRRHDEVLAAGGTCVMASLNWVGFGGMADVRRHAQLPIHGHRNGWGALTRHPALGFSFAAYQKLWRLAGIDHLHCNAPGSKFWEPDESVMAAGRSCLGEFAGVAPLLPAFSSGQWAAHAPVLHAGLGSVDLLHLAGGGIIAHPDGIEAGVASMREAWEAAIAGIDLAAHARHRPALRRALAHFGKG